MIANQLIGTGYGAWTSGFNKDKFFAGLYKIGTLAVGFGVLAISAHFAGNYVEGLEYISGLLLEPIAMYFTKLTRNLKDMIVGSSSESAIAKKGDK